MGNLRSDRHACVISCRKKVFEMRMDGGCTVHPLLSSDRDKIPSSQTATSVDQHVLEGSLCLLRSSHPHTPKWILLQKLSTGWKSQIPIAGWKIKTRRERGRGSK